MKHFHSSIKMGVQIPRNQEKSACHSSTRAVEAGGLRASWLVDPVKLASLRSTGDPALLFTHCSWASILHTYCKQIYLCAKTHVNTPCM